MENHVKNGIFPSNFAIPYSSNINLHNTSIKDTLQFTFNLVIIHI